MDRHSDEVTCSANEVPQSVQDVPASDDIPSGAPSPNEVESTSGHLVEQDDDEDLGGYNGTGRRKPGPKPMVEQHRMKLVLQFIDGDIPGGELGRLRFLQLTQFTPREKSYLMNHACMRELYDAKLFDMTMGLDALFTKEDLKLVEILGKRLGLSKPNTQVNVQVNNNNQDSKKNRKVSIKVAE